MFLISIIRVIFLQVFVISPTTEILIEPNFWLGMFVYMYLPCILMSTYTAQIQFHNKNKYSFALLMSSELK